MTALMLIWVVALVLIGMALAWMSTLIVVRLFRQRADARRAADRLIVMRAFMAVLRDDAGGVQGLAPYAHRARLMAECILELQGVVRGADEIRVLETLNEIGTVRVLAGRLMRGSKAGRLVSLEALAVLGGEAAHAAMRKAVSSREPIVRIAALKGLTQSGAPPSVDALLDHVVNGQVSPSGMYAEILREVVAQSPDSALAALDRTDLSGLLRVMLIEAVGRSGAYQALPRLIEAAADPDPELRTAAVSGLGRLQHPAGAKALEAALGDQAWTVRAAAAEAVGAADLSRLAGKVGDLLSDSQWWVRYRAGVALRRLGPAGIDELTFYAHNGDDVGRRAAEMAMAENG